MNRLARFAFLVLLTTGIAWAAGGITFNGTPKTFRGCPADGGAAQLLTEGPNMLTTTGEETRVCLSRDAGGCPMTAHATALFFPAGFGMQTNLSTDQIYASCGSISDAGNLQITHAE